MDEICKYCEKRMIYISPSVAQVRFICLGQKTAPVCYCNGNPKDDPNHCGISSVRNKFKSKPDKNPYWMNLTVLAEKQREKGIDEYGKGLEEYTTASADERIRYIEEELIDALMYCEWLKDKLSEMDKKGK